MSETGVSEARMLSLADQDHERDPLRPLSFESAYRDAMPRIALSEAQRIVEQIREKLVSGTIPPRLRFVDPYSDTDPSILEFIDHVAGMAEANTEATHLALRTLDA